MDELNCFVRYDNVFFSLFFNFDMIIGYDE